MKHFQDANTSFHSYALKTTVWNHHHKGRCTEEKDIGSCVIEMLKRIRATNPFVDNGDIPKSERNDHKRREIPNKSLFTSRLDTLRKGIINGEQNTNGSIMMQKF